MVPRNRIIALPVEAPVAEMEAVLVRSGHSRLPVTRGGLDDVIGFLLTELGRIPRPGDFITWRGWRFDVFEMDRHRISRVVVHPPEPAGDGTAAEPRHDDDGSGS